MESFNPELAARRTSAESDLNSWQPIYGWPMRYVSMVEARSPGALWRLMRLSPERRQALFAALSRQDGREPANPSILSRFDLDELFELALTAAPRPLLERAFGDCPDGLVGALRKLGFKPHGREIYLRLWEVFRRGGPEDRVRARAIQQLPTLDENLLGAALALDLNLLSPRTVMRCGDAKSAETLNARAQVVRAVCSGETSDTIRSAVETEGRRSWPGWFPTKLSGADRPLPHQLPTDGAEGFERVTPHNAARFAAEFRNCLRTSEVMLARMLSGCFALVAYRGAFKALLEMVKLDEGWAVSMVHVERNGPVSRDIMLKLRAIMEPLGVRVLIVASPPPEAAVMRDAIQPFERMIDILDLD